MFCYPLSLFLVGVALDIDQSRLSYSLQISSSAVELTCGSWEFDFIKLGGYPYRLAGGFMGFLLGTGLARYVGPSLPGWIS